MGENAPPRIAVYFDWQNAYKTAREAFSLSSLPNEHGNFSPYRLARLLAAGNGRGKNGGKLVRVEIHRGLPSQRHDPTGYAANRRQAAAWEGEKRGIVIPRPRPRDCAPPTTGYYARMHRTSLSLPDDLSFALKREAQRRRTSVSAVAREALAERFGLAGAGKPRQVPYAAIGSSGGEGGARAADETLQDVYEQRVRSRRDERRGS